MAEVRKELKVRLPVEVWEEFHRIFPGFGEKQAFLEKMVELAVRKGRKWSLVQLVVEEVEERYGKS